MSGSSISDDDAGEGAELGAKLVGKSFDPSPDIVDAPVQGIVNGGAEADFGGVVGLPVFEAPDVGANLVAVGGYPFGGVQVQEGRFELFKDATAHIEKTGATWASKIFAAGSREHIAADLIDIDGHLADGLAGIDEVEDSGLAGNLANGGDGVDETAIGWNVCDGDELDTLINGFAQRFEGDLSIFIVGDGFDGCASLLGNLEEGDVVAGLLGHGGEDAVARFEGNRIECHVPGSSCVLHNSYFVA